MTSLPNPCLITGWGESLKHYQRIASEARKLTIRQILLKAILGGLRVLEKVSRAFKPLGKASAAVNKNFSAGGRKTQKDVL